VQITSAGPASGKTTLAVMLGRSLAQSGKRVLLVDADVRRPSLARHFAFEPSPGLMDVLADSTAEVRGIRVTSVPQLSVLTAGEWTRQEDFELLANGALSSVLERWRREYDLILLDSSPLLGTADGVILSRQVDGTVLVVRERHCRREALVAALATLSAAGGKLLGTVFVGTRHAGMYGYGYGYAYEYETAPETMDVNVK
jgi:capsular exopolysaccharide synthesis family protein